MNKSPKELTQRIDEKLRQGALSSAIADLEAADLKPIPRELRTEFASLCRRAGVPLLGLKALRPSVRPRAKVHVKATAMENAEYAACLVFAGAVGEALTLLERISSAECPKAILYQAFALTAQWRYEESIPLFKKYIGLGASDYEVLIAQVNLAFAYGFCHSEELSGLVDELLLKTKSYALLQTNVLIVGAHHRFIENDFKGARKLIAQGEKIHGEKKTQEGMLLRKLTHLVSLFENPKSPEFLRELHEFRAEALKGNHWEIVRDCDKFEALSTRNELLFNQVFFGTPYTSYRSCLREDAKGNLKVQSSFDWSVPKPSRNAEIIEVSRLGLKSGSRNHRLLLTLLTDFYRPFTVGGIFSVLFPGEFFNDETGPMRVLNAVRELNVWFEKEGLPLEVAREQSGFQLKTQKPCCFKILGEQPMAEEEWRLKELRENFSSEDFPKFFRVGYSRLKKVR